jgi:FecR-like protein
MRRGIAGVVVATAVLAGSVAGAPASDIYITGKVLGRVQGANSSVVQITWAYKCLGDKLGSATYDWTLKVERSSPQPKKTTTVAKGTSKRGSTTVQLTPGTYLPYSDPYECVTDRGAGYDKPEIGAPFTVPDYCAWSLQSVRGAVQLEQGTAVKAARPGSAVAPGNALVTAKSGSVKSVSLGKDGSLSLGGGSRLEVDRVRCPSKGGWLLRLETGSATVGVPPAASASKRYQVATPDVTSAGTKGARWDVRIAKGKTTVRVFAGKVRAAGAVLKAGQSKTFG